MTNAKRGLLLAAVAAVACLVWLVTAQRGQSQPPAESAKPAPSVPEGQTYTGAKRCGSCHFQQFMSWKTSKHGKQAWECVPKKYQSDPQCLKCHVTGYGVEGGYVEGTAREILANLLGTSCEACHGPGSKHEEVAKKYTTKKKLEPEEEKEVRGSIHKLLPLNACARCHASQGHKEHPKYEK